MITFAMTLTYRTKFNSRLIGTEFLLAISCESCDINDWLNKFYNFYTTIIVNIISRHNLRVYACHLALYNPLLLFNSHLKHLYISNKTEHCSDKSGCGICKHTCI